MVIYFNKTALEKFLVFLLIFSCSCNSYSKKSFFSEKAVWVESVYLRGFRPSDQSPLLEQDIRSFGNNLINHQIHYAYLFAGPYDSSGHLPSYPFSSSALSTVNLLKKICPNVIFLPWIGGVQNRTVYLGNSTWVRNAVKDTRRLVEFLGVPGIHVDLEFIKRGDPFLDSTIQPEKQGDLENYGQWVNDFHAALRKELPAAFISSVVVATSPDTRPWKRKTSFTELKALIKTIDQLSFLYYDTYIEKQDVFEKNLEYLLSDIQKLRQERNIQYLISIGTFVNDSALQKYRNLAIENIPNTLRTMTRLLSKRVPQNERTIDGISIFSDWETDPDEWREIDEGTR